MTAVQHLKRIALGLSLLGLAAHASAQVQVSDAWVRDSKLLSVQSPVAKDVQIHEMSMKDDVMRMGPVDAVALPAGKAVTLDPEGYHVMLMSLTGQIKEGDQVPLTLTVENAKGQKQSIEVKASARSLGSTDDHHHMH